MARMTGYLTKRETAQLLGCGLDMVETMIRSEMMSTRYCNARGEAMVNAPDAVRVQWLRRWLRSSGEGVFYKDKGGA